MRSGEPSEAVWLDNLSAAELRRTWRQIPERESVGFEDRIPIERLIGGGAKADSLMVLLNLTMRGRVYFWQRRR